MAKVQHIKRARASKKTRACRICGHVVQAGEPYKKIAKRVGMTSSTIIVFCQEHNPRSSDLLSGRSAELAEIVENIEDGLLLAEQDKDAVQSALESAGDEIESFAESVRESGTNIEEGLGHSTMQSDSMSETADALDEWGRQLTELGEEVEDEDDDERDFAQEARDIMGEQPELNLTG